MFEELWPDASDKPYDESLGELSDALSNCDSVIIGAGSGLSTAAGYLYAGEIMDRYFRDFQEVYHIRDMYSGGFYPFPTRGEYWAWWSRHIWLNRYRPIPNDLYERLLDLVRGKDYFVLTTNVDHCFQRAGFDKSRLFYTQGDYGLFQSVSPGGAARYKTYDNETIVRQMLLSQGWEITPDNMLKIPAGGNIRMTIDTSLIPVCPDDGEDMVPNLRSDDTFVEDAGWHEAATRYNAFLERHENRHILYLELGVGNNTPVIIKFPFWRQTLENKNAVYACINKGAAIAPPKIRNRSILIDADIYQVVRDLQKNRMRS